jgi:acetyltransferase-like isoleucine patch superfamily enzyme
MIDFFFNKILPILLYGYENYFMFRIKRSWGIANLKKIRNKGENVKVMGYTRFLDPDNIFIGNNVRIGYGCFFFGKGGIIIGDNTILSRNITIYSSNHNYKSNMIPYNDQYIDKPVKIGKGVWIGMGVSITPGVTIGDGAIIGMGAVISKNVNPGEIVVNVGQRVVLSRDMNEFEKLLDSNQIYSFIYPNN